MACFKISELRKLLLMWLKPGKRTCDHGGFWARDDSTEGRAASGGLEDSHQLGKRRKKELFLLDLHKHYK